ncbi:MAG: diguanylate cyclase [Candidatus Omnitrophica bacterium]|jgi:diguanylate cyclase (GGDEF)-like protein|nr:diguanylate cyclase [Candidatus Omnitrophota bacterium]
MNKQINVLLSPGNLKYKLRMVFYLMLVLPFLVLGYVIMNYFLPSTNLTVSPQIMWVLTISVIVAVTGFFIIKEVFDRVSSISAQARIIAKGDFQHIVKTSKGDEVGYLGDALNQLTSKIRSNMDELKGYSERTTKINLEIQKRVLVLSSLLQISSLVSQGLKLEEILLLSVQKARTLANSDVAFILSRESDNGDFFMKAVDGANAQYLSKVKVIKGDDIFPKISNLTRPLTVDKANYIQEKDRELIYERFRLKNFLSLPIFVRGSLSSILVIGNNREDFCYHEEDVELLDIFAKQLSIAVENDMLSGWVDELEIKDNLTGLYNESFIKSRLQEEIKRAIVYQKPCSLVIFNIDNFQNYSHKLGALQTEAALKKTANIIRDFISESDRAARTGDNEFAVVLQDKNKRASIRMAEEVRKKVEVSLGNPQAQDMHLTISGAVSENPIDGVSSDELFLKARESLKMAKAQGGNRISI